jgi:hypothetical protein
VQRTLPTFLCCLVIKNLLIIYFCPDRASDAISNQADKARAEDGELDAVIGFKDASFTWSPSTYAGIAHRGSLPSESRASLCFRLIESLTLPTGSDETSVLCLLWAFDCYFRYSRCIQWRMMLHRNRVALLAEKRRSRVCGAGNVAFERFDSCTVRICRRRLRFSIRLTFWIISRTIFSSVRPATNNGIVSSSSNVLWSPISRCSLLEMQRRLGKGTRC